MDPVGKANLISKKLAEKNTLAEIAQNNYSTIKKQSCSQEDVPLPTTKMSFEVMNSLREDSGTGPDNLPAKNIKRCAAQLAYPVAILAMRIIMSGILPEA